MPINFQKVKLQLHCEYLIFSKNTSGHFSAPLFRTEGEIRLYRFSVLRCKNVRLLYFRVQGLVSAACIFEAFQSNTSSLVTIIVDVPCDKPVTIYCTNMDESCNLAFHALRHTVILVLQYFVHMWINVLLLSQLTTFSLSLSQTFCTFSFLLISFYM